ncbi:YigZ family protein [Terracoccus sp. 273MFTsu3.1]|uniref:IMPACT family protein n=1 Tax=Terracoccus sp. 273MFTsu3.1 TaxID=1172188 RepID=UPI000374138D|nr:YigZ family protein [Terracoccus sp. 273MFTsu3.1]
MWLSPPRRYLTLASPASAELEVKRSRFLCDVAPVASEEDARAFIETVRSATRDAGHHCTAFVLGPDGDTQRSNDDGEPSGTAGAPMLDVLRGRALTDVVAVVTRWFGGTLLGTGGLIRAYGDAVTSAVDAATPVAYALRDGLVVTVGSADAPRVENALRGHPGCAVTSTTWGATGIVLALAVEPGTSDSVRGLVGALTAGAGEVTGGPGSWVRVPTR